MVLLLPLIILPLMVLCQKTELPLHIADNLMLIEGSIHDKTGFFILDLGASGLILNSRHFTGKVEDGLEAVSLNGSQERLKKRVVNFSLGSLSWKNQSATLIPLTHLEKAKKRQILGLVGGKVFRKSKVVIDLGSMQMQIVKKQAPISNYDYNEEVQMPESIIPLRFKSGLPLMEVRINNASFLFGLDTAAEANIVSKKHLPFLENIMSKRRSLLSRDVSGKTKRVLAANLSDIKVGLLKCYPMKTLFTDLSFINQNLAGPSLDGILGFDFFRQFKVAIDFKNSEIRLWRHRSNFQGPLFLASQLVADTSSVFSEKNKR